MRSPFLSLSTPQAVIFLCFAILYIFLAWVVCGGENWWVIDYVDGQNIFYGDDAYRFFLSRSFLYNFDLYTYNFVLPGSLILDGVLTTLTDGDLFISRSAHALVGAASLSLLYDSMKRIGVSASIALFAILILGLLPRFSLMSISFYGEAWLGGFICLSIWLFVRERFYLLAFVASWLPLLRPEGIFFLFAYGLYFISKRNWRALIVLVLPGLSYFLYLNSALPSLSYYNNWRLELRTILSKLSPGVGKWDLFGFYSILYIAPAAAGIALKPMRKIWPVTLGAGAWLAWFQGLVIFGLATVESRYAFPLYPVLTISWAVFFFTACDVLHKQGLNARLVGLVSMSVAAIVISSHLFKMSLVQRAVSKHGLTSVFNSVVHGEWSRIYSYRSAIERDGWKYLNDVMIDVVKNDPGTNKIAIYDSVLFYNLDPREIPRHVTVGFLTSGYMVFHILMDGQTFIQHPGGRMYSYLNYGEPDFGHDERRVLVADIMPMSGYPYTWKSGGYELYLFSYAESGEANNDLDSKPTITPEYLRQTYYRIKKQAAE